MAATYYYLRSSKLFSTLSKDWEYPVLKPYDLLKKCFNYINHSVDFFLSSDFSFKRMVLALPQYLNLLLQSCSGEIDSLHISIIPDLILSHLSISINKLSFRSLIFFTNSDVRFQTSFCTFYLSSEWVWVRVWRVFSNSSSLLFDVLLVIVLNSALFVSKIRAMLWTPSQKMVIFSQ